jgi:hypothetical protein
MVVERVANLRVGRVLMVLLMITLSHCVVAERSSPASVINMMEVSDTIRATGYAVINLQASDLPEQRRLLAIRASRLDAQQRLVPCPRPGGNLWGRTGKHHASGCGHVRGYPEPASIRGKRSAQTLPAILP